MSVYAMWYLPLPSAVLTAVLLIMQGDVNAGNLNIFYFFKLEKKTSGLLDLNIVIIITIHFNCIII